MYRLRGNHAKQNSWNVHFVSDLTSSFFGVLRFPVRSVLLQPQRSAGGMATNQGMSLKFRWLHHHNCQQEFHFMAPALLYLFTIFHTIRKSVSPVGKATKLQRTRGNNYKLGWALSTGVCNSKNSYTKKLWKSSFFALVYLHISYRNETSAAEKADYTDKDWNACLVWVRNAYRYQKRHRATP